MTETTSNPKSSNLFQMIGAITVDKFRQSYRGFVNNVTEKYETIHAGRETTEQRETILTQEKRRVTANQELKHATENEEVQDGTKYWFARGARYNEIQTSKKRLETAEANADHAEELKTLENTIELENIRTETAKKDQAVTTKTNLTTENGIKTERKDALEGVYQQTEILKDLDNEILADYIKHQKVMGTLDDATLVFEEQQERIDLNNQERENARKQMKAEYVGLKKSNNNLYQKAKNFLFRRKFNRKLETGESEYAIEMGNIARERSKIFASGNPDLNDLDAMTNLSTREIILTQEKKFEDSRRDAISTLLNQYA